MRTTGSYHSAAQGSQPCAAAAGATHSSLRLARLQRWGWGCGWGWGGVLGRPLRRRPAAPPTPAPRRAGSQTAWPWVPAGPRVAGRKGGPGAGRQKPLQRGASLAPAVQVCQLALGSTARRTPAALAWLKLRLQALQPQPSAALCASLLGSRQWHPGVCDMWLFEPKSWTLRVFSRLLQGGCNSTQGLQTQGWRCNCILLRCRRLQSGWQHLRHWESTKEWISSLQACRTANIETCSRDPLPALGWANVLHHAATQTAHTSPPPHSFTRRLDS